MDDTTAKKILEDILKLLGIEFESIENTSDDTGISLNITTQQSGMLIGHRGDVLAALNHVVKKIIGKANEDIGVSVDVNGYRKQAQAALKDKAKILALRAKSFKTSVELPPMSSYERLIIHSFLADDPNIETVSVGEGKNRRIIIRYKE